mmetsp:Transcript_23086/g.46750  ORF Transcript_23086/g.46750 Transcript_23086/m.46750 type:complete len:241 (+) Transcript_23086:1052-1774(+)
MKHPSHVCHLRKTLRCGPCASALPTGTRGHCAVTIPSRMRADARALPELVLGLHSHRVGKGNHATPLPHGGVARAAVADGGAGEHGEYRHVLVRPPACLPAFLHPVQALQSDDGCERVDGGAHGLHELHPRNRSPPRREQVVDDHSPVTRLDRPEPEAHLVQTLLRILLGVARALHQDSWALSVLAQQNKGDVEGQSNWRPQNKPPRVAADNGGRSFAGRERLVVRREDIDDILEELGIF